MKAPLYRSETRSITISEIPSALRIALVQYAERKKLRLVDVTAWLTNRENAPASTMLGRLFGRRKSHAEGDASCEVVFVLHKTHLLVVTSFATSGAVRDTSVLSLPLLAATLTPSDDGLTISGFPANDGPATYVLGLGAGAAAANCVSAAMAAVDAAKKPAA